MSVATILEKIGNYLWFYLSKESKSWWLRGQVIDKIEEDKQEIDYEVKLLTIWAEKGQKITSSDII